LIKCKICGEIFSERERAREHVKSKHREQVKYILSQLRFSKIKNLKKQDIDPENRLLDASLNTQINTRVASHNYIYVERVQLTPL
jgi:hypothetical protein